ncbi:hypothetical protein MUA41_07970 [Staphylococcus simulans]|uniref:hypothetical protein n=1 Tax=Staphylococcus simulans TaxID=1286 RepID=UPI0021D1B03E|nr:hypothetical protein [Staphylococcus simulans]UXR34303.1 hypothetical protein MUA31_07885 [Staphylococcus simulans]UXR36969.1 hypothetical protein MUA41_07970 [Staphylococcus simulans]
MVKIEINREFNLAGMLEYIIKNEITDKYYFNSARNAVVEVTKNGFISFLNTFKPDDTFTVKVEEEITEDTKIPTLMVVYNFPEEKGIYCNTYYNLSIKYILDTKNNEVNIKSFHMVNQDGTLTLLWTREGECSDASN